MTLPDIQARLQAFASRAFCFDADAHAYTLHGQPLVSWSKWIEQYLEPFPEAQAAAASASKRGITAEEVLAEWEWSRTLGTLVHAWIEQWYKTTPNAAGVRLLTLPDHPEVRERCQKFLAIHALRLHQLTPLAMELQAHHGGAGVAGTLDFIVMHPDRVGVCVMDWKTNSLKSFTRNSQPDPYRKRMRGALSDIRDSKENLYSLQNSFYRVLLEEAGIPTWGGAIVHLPPGPAQAEVIQCTDYRARIRALILK